MRNLLAIAGCGPRLEVALRHAGSSAPALAALSGSAPRSDLIVAAVDLLLRAAGLAAGDLDAVVVTRGPGSFTGIRVALATAQGIALGAGVPAQGFPSLLAQAARSDVASVLAVQPARRGEVYAQPFARSGKTWQATGPAQVRTLASFPDHSLPVIGPAGLELPAAVSLAPALRSTAEALLLLADSLTSSDGETLSPLYLEAPAAIPLRREG